MTGPPRKFDVLLGRGKTASSHTGNLRLFHIVDMNRSKYEKLGRYQKHRFSGMIVHLVNQSGGRFLKKVKTTMKNSGGKAEQQQWIEVTSDEARDKISHCFRRIRELDTQKESNNRNSNNNISTRRCSPSSATDETTTSFTKKRSKIT